VDLKNFTQQVYSILLRNIDILPSKLNETASIMIQEDWLSSYQEFNGFEMAIARISKRLRQGNILLECIADIKANYYPLLMSFDEFFPQVIDYVTYERILLSTRN